MKRSRLRVESLLSGPKKVWGEGHGNPLQYSCLENPRDRGAWWAAFCGVAQSQTRLKQLSSSSSKKLWRVLNKKGNRIYICF